MNITAPVDELNEMIQEKPGAQLARIRESKGLSQEDVAASLHLRVKIIDLLESDSYYHMPEPVFIKGYLRAYAKLLDLSPEPLLAIFDSLYSPERKSDKAALWQGRRRESKRMQRFVRWFTILIVISAIVGASLWWQKNKDVQTITVDKVAESKEEAAVDENPEVKLTDLSRMQSLFTTAMNENKAETQGG